MTRTLSLILATVFPCLTMAQQADKTGVCEHPLPDSGAPYGYLSYLPPKYDARNGKHPLVIFLHGYGELGDGKTTLGGLSKHGPFKLIKKDPSIFAQANAVVLAPQGLKSDNWWRWEKLDDFLKHAMKTYSIDKDRIYLTGLSMGGGGTWMMASRHPRTFAALVPICGASKPPAGGKDLKFDQVPIWAFHSIGDKTVGMDNSELWLNALAGTEKRNKLLDDYPKTGTQSASLDGRKWVWTEGQQAPTSNMGITVYPDSKHDSWTRAYKDPKLWDWLFAQKR